MDRRRDLRLSDRERQAGVDRLRLAHDEGRLSLMEYDNRVVLAYQAVTYGDLADLFTDLPEPSVAPQPGLTMPIAPPRPAAPTMPTMPIGPSAPVAQRADGVLATAPRWVKKLWAVWGTILVVNLVAWILVDFGNHGREDFWPRWLLIPTVIVAGISAGAVALSRDGRR
jgi:hypothetical protein